MVEYHEDVNEISIVDIGRMKNCNDFKGCNFGKLKTLSVAYVGMPMFIAQSFVLFLFDI